MKFCDKGTVKDLLKQSRQRKLTAEMQAIMEEAYSRNDKLTSVRIENLLTEWWPDLRLSFPMIKDTTSKNKC